MSESYTATSAIEHLPVDLREPLYKRLEALRRERVVHRIWDRDHTVWKENPVEITQPDRLGWLHVAEAMLPEVEALKKFADDAVADGFTDVLLLGMGGSSLGPEVLYAMFGSSPGRLRLKVLDSTVPAEIRSVESQLDLATTLFIVASKSGSTIETMSQFAYFWQKKPDGASFVAITDPGTSLESLALERGFRRCFLYPDSIGGRYSALSYFGLVPAALIGVDLDALLHEAMAMAHACRQSDALAANPGAWLGALMAEGTLAGRDKLTLLLGDGISAFGTWAEQLIAESTGKEGKGILPVHDEPVLPGDAYADDRLFVALGSAEVSELETAGQPVTEISFKGPIQLGAEFFRWEFATAIAGHILAINPFDQPNVQQAKDSAGRFLSGESSLNAAPGDLQETLASIQPGDYLGIQAYLPRSDATLLATLQAVRLKLANHYRVATTLGYGPRYLHSTGQIHKGGPNSGVFIQIVDEVAEDISIPGRPYTFGQLLQAQADGDLDALLNAGRRAVRVSLTELMEFMA